MLRPIDRKSRKQWNAVAAVRPEQVSAIAYGVFAGAMFIAGLALTDAHSVRTLFAADEHGFVALGALFVMLAWLFAILAFAIKILPDEGPAGWGELKPVRLSAKPKRRSAADGSTGAHGGAHRAVRTQVLDGIH